MAKRTRNRMTNGGRIINARRFKASRHNRRCHDESSSSSNLVSDTVRPKATDSHHPHAVPSDPIGMDKRHLKTAAGVSVLLGISIAMIVTALVAGFQNLFGGRWITARIVIAAAFSALAVGLRVPQQFTMWVCARTWRRVVRGGQGHLGPDLWANPPSVDRSLCWMVLSTIMLAAGIATALLPIGMNLVSHTHDWLHATFVWSRPPLILLRAALAFTAMLVPLALLGLAVSFAHRLCCPYGKWETKTTAWLLLGGSAGTLLASTIVAATGSANLGLIAAALPALFSCVMAALASSSRAGDAREEWNRKSSALPLYTDRWPTLLRAGIVVVAGAAAWAIATYGEWIPSTSPASVMIYPSALTALAMGVLAGCRTHSAPPRTIGGFGSACVAAGLVGVATTVCMILSTQTTVAVMVGAWLCLFAIGYAMAYGRKTLLDRVASRPSAGAAILTRMLIGCALVVCLGVPLALHGLGRVTTWTIVALSLVLLGGMLAIHEPGRIARRRTVPLIMVYGSLGVMIVIAVVSTHRHTPKPKHSVTVWKFPLPQTDSPDVASR